MIVMWPHIIIIIIIIRMTLIILLSLLLLLLLLLALLSSSSLLFHNEGVPFLRQQKLKCELLVALRSLRPQRSPVSVLSQGPRPPAARPAAPWTPQEPRSRATPTSRPQGAKTRAMRT